MWVISQPNAQCPMPNAQCLPTTTPVHQYRTGSSGRSVYSPAMDARVPSGRGEVTVQDIGVVTYRPASHGSTSPVLVVLHGAHRNAGGYRDAWVDIAEAHDVLVLCPCFARDAFPTSREYNLAGMTDRTKTLTPRSTWLFARIEPLVTELTGTPDRRFDLFGHSAGAQVVHRTVLFGGLTRIHRAVAANAGWYTMPTDEARFPYGLREAPEVNLEQAFATPLHIMLGEKDNTPYAGGVFRTTRQAMRQGAGRRQRGDRFIETAHTEATRRDMRIAWDVQHVPNVGHSYRKMARAAGAWLYGG